MRYRGGVASKGRGQGFALIEAMISLLVLSIGLLGVAAMQLKALQSAQIGYQRSLVSLIAIDGQERVWSAYAENRAGGASGSASCPSASTINNEWLDYWQDAVAMMSAESGSLTTAISDAGGPCMYNLVVSWEDARVGRVPEGCDESERDDDGECLFEPEITDMNYAFRLPVL